MAHVYPKFTVSQVKDQADIFNGDYYRCNVFSETVADNGIVNFFIKTKAVGISMGFEAEAGGLSQITVTEAATMENAGTNQTIFNQNRNSAKTSTISVTHGNSFSNGTAVFQDTIGNATQGNATGGGQAHQNMIVLAGSEHYNVGITNISGGAINVYLSLNYTDVT